MCVCDQRTVCVCVSSLHSFIISTLSVCVCVRVEFFEKVCRRVASLSGLKRPAAPPASESQHNYLCCNGRLGATQESRCPVRSSTHAHARRRPMCGQSALRDLREHGAEMTPIGLLQHSTKTPRNFAYFGGVRLNARFIATVRLRVCVWLVYIYGRKRAHVYTRTPSQPVAEVSRRAVVRGDVTIKLH